MNDIETSRRPATMADVARHVGVSVMTVSNVINGLNARVSESTRQRVLDAIEEIGYRVNIPARQLRQGRTGVVALAIPDFESPYFSGLAERLATRFLEQNLRLVVERTGGEPTREVGALAAYALNAYDALILSVTATDPHDLDEMRPTKPVILLGEQSASEHYDHVVMDNVEGAAVAVGALLDAGARRVIALGGRDTGPTAMPLLRTRGYRAAHVARGLDIDETLVVDAPYTMAGGRGVLTDLIEAGYDFDAVFGLTDPLAVGALAALTHHHVAVPEDVQVVGWDDTELVEFTTPSLSSVSPDNDAIADAVVRLVLQRLDGHDADRGPEVVMPRARLVRRESIRGVHEGADFSAH